LRHAIVADVRRLKGEAMTKTGRWVLLTYHLPREPSTPRIAVWRKLKRLGVAHLADGLVALPRDARTQEQLEWVADEVIEAGGSAAIWFADPGTATTERSIAAGLAEARAAEYAEVAAEGVAALEADLPEARRVLRRLRRQLRRIRRRDYFPPPQREEATAAVERVAEQVASAEEPATRGDTAS
jgi:hypothetical protein